MSVEDKPTYNSKESEDSVKFFVAHVITADHLIATAGEHETNITIMTISVSIHCHFFPSTS